MNYINLARRRFRTVIDGRVKSNNGRQNEEHVLDNQLYEIEA